MKSKKKISLIVGLVLVILLGGGYVVYTKFFKETNNATKQEKKIVEKKDETIDYAKYNKLAHTSYLEEYTKMVNKYGNYKLVIPKGEEPTKKDKSDSEYDEAEWQVVEGVWGLEVFDSNNDGIDEMVIMYNPPYSDTSIANAKMYTYDYKNQQIKELLDNEIGIHFGQSDVSNNLGFGLIDGNTYLRLDKDEKYETYYTLDENNNLVKNTFEYIGKEKDDNPWHIDKYYFNDKVITKKEYDEIHKKYGKEISFIPPYFGYDEEYCDDYGVDNIFDLNNYLCVKEQRTKSTKTYLENNEYLKATNNFEVANSSSTYKIKPTEYEWSDYYYNNVIDNDKKTAWVSGTKNKTSVGQYLMLGFIQKRLYNGIKISNGYMKNQYVYDTNAKATKIKVIFDDNTSEEFDIKNTKKYKDNIHEFKFSKPKLSKTIKIEILKQENGKKTDDNNVAITEVTPF